MPKAKYEGIYHSIKKRIEAQDYPYQSLLPSENTLIEEYACSSPTALCASYTSRHTSLCVRLATAARRTASSRSMSLSTTHADSSASRSHTSPWQD